MTPGIEFEVMLPSSDPELLKEAVSTAGGVTNVWRRLPSLKMSQGEWEKQLQIY